jgi:basic membrane lipoprotein Med (substrate-binding protein (PBP1-ABC) superfamily)
VILASGVIDIPLAFLQIAQEVQKQTFRSRIIHLGMKEGVISLVYNPSLQSHIPASVQDRLATIKERIISGAFVVPSVEFTPVSPANS